MLKAILRNVHLDGRELTGCEKNLVVASILSTIVSNYTTKVRLYLEDLIFSYLKCHALNCFLNVVPNSKSYSRSPMKYTRR